MKSVSGYIIWIRTFDRGYMHYYNIIKICASQVRGSYMGYCWGIATTRNVRIMWKTEEVESIIRLLFGSFLASWVTVTVNSGLVWKLHEDHFNNLRKLLSIFYVTVLRSLCHFTVNGNHIIVFNENSWNNIVKCTAYCNLLYTR